MQKQFKIQIFLVIIFSSIFLLGTSLVSASTITTTLRYGMKDIQVKYLQEFLNEKGYTVATTGIGSKGQESTYFGPATLNAVKAYQRAYSLVADGIFGAKSRATLSNTTTNTNNTSTTNNNTSYKPGCTSTTLFSATTGLPCKETSNTSLPTGCTSTSLYSATTGLSCKQTTTTTYKPGCSASSKYSATTGLLCTNTTTGGGTTGGGGGGGGGSKEDDKKTSNKSPTVSISTSNTSFTSPANITISATASDTDGTISKVDFYNGSTLLYTDITSPYTFAWTGVLPGTYTLKAIATDDKSATGNSSNLSVVVNTINNTVLDQAPYITVQPTNQTVATGGTATFSVTASSTNTLGYQWWRSPYVDKTSKITNTPGKIEGATTNQLKILNTDSSDNNTSYVVEVYNANNYPTNGYWENSNKASLTVSSTSNNSPTVSISTNNTSFTSPANITISATASDSDGTISKVDFYNGSTLLYTDTTSPYTFAWTGVLTGTYTLKAIATDNSNATTTSSTTTVTVANEVIPPTETSWPTATHYIDPKNGNDSNDGKTKATAWKTIAKSNLYDHKPGDVIEFLGDETILGSKEYIQPKNSGTKNNPITYRSEKNHRTTLANSNYQGHTIRLDSEVYPDKKPRDYITFTNLRIVNKYWGRIDGTKGVRIENVEAMHYDEINPSIEETYGGGYWGVWGFRMENTSYSVIRNNKFYGSQIGSSQDILQMSDLVHHNLIENNMFHDAGHVIISLAGNNDGKGKIEPLSNDARFNVIRNNYFYNKHHSGPISNVGGYFVLYDSNFAERLGTGTLVGENYKYRLQGGNELGGFTYGSGINGILRNNIISRSGSSQHPTGYELTDGVPNSKATWYGFGPIGSDTSWGSATDKFAGNIGTSENKRIYNNVFYKNWGTVVSAGNGLSNKPIEGSERPLYKNYVFKNNIFYKNGEPGENFPGTTFSKNKYEDMFIHYDNQYYEIGGLDWQKKEWNDKWLSNLMEDVDNNKILLYGSQKYNNYFTLSQLENGIDLLPSTTFDNNIQGNPKFINPDASYNRENLDAVRNQFALGSGSVAKDTGAYLTTATNFGSNSTTVYVADPYYFAGGATPTGKSADLGWDNIIEGDTIQIGNEIVKILSIDYDAKKLIINRAISWSSGTNISMPYSGSKPDMGLLE